MNNSKENILQRIQKGKQSANLWNNVSEPKHSNFFKKQKQETLIETFRIALEKIDGQLIIANNKTNLQQELQTLFSIQPILCIDNNLQNILTEYNIQFSDQIDLKSNPMGFISCEYIVARLGSVLTSSALPSGRQANIFPEHQVVFVQKDQIVYDIKDALENIRKNYTTLPSMISFATGPSRTADIEKTLILGAHGPKMLTIIYKNFD